MCYCTESETGKAFGSAHSHNKLIPPGGELFRGEGFYSCGPAGYGISSKTTKKINALYNCLVLC